MTGERVHNRRFVVIAPIGRDGELICALLHTSGFPAECVGSIAEASGVDSGSLLGIILTDEAMARDGVESLRVLVDSQPDWSDLPVILLTSGANEFRFAALATQARIEIRSLILLDRPVRKEQMLSAVQVAYTSRLKQLEVRDAVDRQYRSDEALRNTEKLAVAGRLAATMAHEVNNPLEALNNLLFLVENSGTLEEAQSFAHLAVQELDRISEIVQHTLRFHRAPVMPAYTDVAELATSALALFRGKLRERHVHENVETEKCFAYCSAGEIRQAIVNVIGNAIDAMPEGGTLKVRTCNITLNGLCYARISIADTGSGIRPEIRSSLFTQFFTTKGSRGTGLGLWLTRDIVRRNNGRLRYRSRIKSPTGTVFTIYLPAAPQHEMGCSDDADTAAQTSVRVKKEGAPEEMEAA